MYTGYLQLNSFSKIIIESNETKRKWEFVPVCRFIRKFHTLNGAANAVIVCFFNDTFSDKEIL